MTTHTVRACPECDRAGPEPRQREADQQTPAQTVYRCDTCGARFDDPVIRPAKRNRPRKGLAGKLARADATGWGRGTAGPSGDVSTPRGENDGR